MDSYVVGTPMIPVDLVKRHDSDSDVREDGGLAKRPSCRWSTHVSTNDKIRIVNDDINFIN